MELIFVDFGPEWCIGVWPRENAAASCVICDGTRPGDERCGCACHRDGLPVLDFIDGNLDLVQLFASAWHDPDRPCGQPRSDDDVLAEIRLMGEVPAVMEVGCACASQRWVADLCQTLRDLAHTAGPDAAATRRIACTWREVDSFNPLWALT